MGEMSVTEMESVTERRASCQEMIAFYLFASEREPGDPSWPDLQPEERAAYRAEARGAIRRLDPIVRAVRYEVAARAYAESHGWEWPSLAGYATADNRTELARIEARQHIRRWAKDMVHAADQHASEGNPKDIVGFEDSIFASVKTSNADDTAVRKALKTPTSFREHLRETAEQLTRATYQEQP